MSTEAPPPMDPRLRALLRRAATIPIAPASARSRVRAQLIPLTGPFGPGADGGDDHAGGGDTGGGSPAISSTSARFAADASASVLRRLLPVALAGFVLGGGAGALATRALLSRPTAAPSPAGAEHGVPTVVPAEAARREPEAPPAPIARAGGNGEEAPAPQARAAGSSFTAERLLLDQAREALERDAPTAALATANRHARRYPHGVLTQEREVMTIRALTALHRDAEARQRAARFHARFPGSLFWPSIDASVGRSTVEP